MRRCSTRSRACTSGSGPAASAPHVGCARTARGRWSRSAKPRKQFAKPNRAAANNRACSERCNRRCEFVHDPGSDRGDGLRRGCAAGRPVYDRRARSHARAISAPPQPRAREPVPRARLEPRHGRSTARGLHPGVPVAARLARRGEPLDLDRSRVRSRRVSLPVSTRPPDPDGSVDRRGQRAGWRSDRRSPPARARRRPPAVRGARRARCRGAPRVHAARDRWPAARRGRRSRRFGGDRDKAPGMARAGQGRGRGRRGSRAARVPRYGGGDTVTLRARIPVEQHDDECVTNFELKHIIDKSELATKPARRGLPSLWFRGAGVVAIAAAAVIGWKLHTVPAAEPPPVAAAQHFAVTDGSKISLDGATLAGTASYDVTREPQRVVIEMQRGQLDLAVVPDPHRTLVIRAADTEIEDVGTRFRVDFAGASGVQVRVTEGEVVVTRPAQLVRVAAGNGWTTARGLLALTELDPVVVARAAPLRACEPVPEPVIPVRPHVPDVPVAHAQPRHVEAPPVPHRETVAAPADPFVDLRTAIRAIPLARG